MDTAPPDLESWLRIAHCRGLGAASRIRLLRHFGRPADIFSADGPALRAAGVAQRLRHTLAQPPTNLTELTERTARWLETDNHQLITWSDPRYPDLLRQIPDPPVVLYTQGDPGQLTPPAIAIVGSRKPSAAGVSLATEWAGQLAHCGLTIVSGLAHGIDAAAHRGCLAESGSTVAVVGTGLDQVYPRRHAELAVEVARRGVLVSEFALGTPPLGRHFPQRNRIICGLSLATVVVEATLRSGTLSTARHALEQGREVMAVPGPVRSQLARGCHQLLRQGATLIESAADILAEIAPQIDTDTLLPAGSSATAQGPSTRQAVSDPDCEQLLELIGYEPMSVDRLVSGSGLSASQVTVSLLQLELTGVVAVDSGGRYTRC